MNPGTVYTGGGEGAPTAALPLFPRVTSSSGGGPAGVQSPPQQSVHQSIHEALMSRIRPFGLAGADLSELAAGGGLTPASLGNLVRPDGFPHLPLLSHMQNNGFLSHSLASAGAFRPMFSSLQTENSIYKSFPSAFQPPASREKVSPSSLFSPGQNLFPHLSPSSSRSSPSPLSKVSPAPFNKGDENSNTESNICFNDSRSEEEDREQQTKRLRMSAGLLCCPICGMGIEPSEIESHYIQEVDYLSKLTLGLVKDVQTSNISRYSYSQNMEQAPRTRWESYQRIQRNRQSRIRVKIARKVGKRMEEEMEDTRGPQDTPDDNVDIVGEDEENNQVKAIVKEEKNTGYGDIQFTEEDILNFMNTENCKAQPDESIIAEDENDNNDTELNGSIKSDDDIKENDSIKEEGGENNNDDDIAEKESSNIDESSVKEKLCPTCKKNGPEVIVSIQCWHVQCKSCWFKQLARERKCNRCESPCEPKHLRNVHL